MLRTFNCGIGFVLCVAPTDLTPALAILEEAGESPKLIGEIVTAGDRVLSSGQMLLSASGEARLG